MAAISDNLQGMTTHLLTCLPLFTSGYANIQELTNAIKGYSPIFDEREYEDVRFSDMLGTYFWIEKTSEVSFSQIIALQVSKCKGRSFEAIQRYSVFAFGRGLKEVELFECLAGCVSDYACDVQLSGGSYDSIGVLKRYLTTAQISEQIISNIQDFAAVRVDFSMRTVVLPTNHGIENCYCQTCKDC